MKYECFIMPAHAGCDIEADSAAAARRQFAELIRENLEEEHIIANNLDTADGNDPSPNPTGQPRTASVRSVAPGCSNSEVPNE